MKSFAPPALFVTAVWLTVIVGGSLLPTALAAQEVEQALETATEEVTEDAAPAEPGLTVDELKAELDTLRFETDLLWTCLAAFLVFGMQAGFAYLEAGFVRTKNVVNILMKNSYTIEK